MRRYYQILGVSPTASPQEIKEAWLFSLKAFHPDKFADASRHQQAVAEARTQAINEAYKILSDPVSRSVYDRDYFREVSYEKAPTKSEKPSIVPPPAPPRKPAAQLAPLKTVSFLRRRPVLIILAGIAAAGVVGFLIINPNRSRQPVEPPFSQIILPSPVAPAPVVPTTVANTPAPTQSVVFDLPKLAATARKSVGLVIGYDAKGTLIQTGSGFFISKDGRFVTNEHVIHGAKRLSIKMENGGFYSVSDTLAQSTRFDLAILQIRATDMPSLELETSGIPEVGSRIAVIGSPIALEGTLSDGIVSAVRTENEGTWIQITAPISPGSSGSPVLNAQGRVIGVVTLGSNGRIQNLNFARSTSDLLALSQSIGSQSNSATANGFAALREKVPLSTPPPPASPRPTPAHSIAPTSTPALTLAQSPTPAEMLRPSPTSSPTTEPASPTPQQTYRVVGLPRTTPFLNIRSGAGSTFAVVGIFTPKGRGIILGPGRTANGKTIWQEVFSGDFHGWVNAQYLAPETTDMKPSADEIATPSRPSGKLGDGHN